MAQTEHILVVDDDSEIRHLLGIYLQKNGYRVSVAADGKGMWTVLDKGKIDLIVLDLMLPGDDGLVLCRNLRANSQVPVIMLTARGDEMDRIIGLEMGADDYLPKPFNPRELLARIKVVLRRAKQMPATSEDTDVTRFRFTDWCLDTSKRHLLSPDGVVVPLSSGEYRLMRVFLTHPNRVLSRDQLLDLTRGREADPFDRSIDVLVGRLRKRLGDTARDQQFIQTVRGEGYLLAARVTKE